MQRPPPAVGQDRPPRPGRVRRHCRAVARARAATAAGAAGCGFGALRRRLCQRHLGAWVRAGEPDIDDWLASVPPVAPQPGQAACRVSFCPWWAHPRAVLCYYHHRRWKALGCPDLAGFLAGYERPADADRERADLTALPAQLRLEVQYALQCRRDEATLKTKPATIGSLVRWLAASGAVSLLDRSEQAWRACLPAPYRQDRAAGRAADLRPPHGHHAGGGTKAGTTSTPATPGSCAAWASTPRPSSPCSSPRSASRG